MEQARDLMVTYSGAIKSVDPDALVVGPEEWGWSGYIFSGYDQQYGSQHGWSFLPDRAAHGGKDYLRWLLEEFKLRSDIDQQKVLDVFTVHYYPQGGEFSNDTVVGDAAAPQPLDALAVGSELHRRDLDRRSRAARAAPAQPGQHLLLRRHADRHHRIQLGRRKPHQRRDDAGGHLRHLRPRRSRHGRALDDARDDHADLQGDEDVPQLRRQPIGVRRDERARDVDRQRRQPVGLCG